MKLLVASSVEPVAGGQTRAPSLTNTAVINRFGAALAALAVVLSFFPYVAVGLGANTSISVGALLGLASWLFGPRLAKLDLIVASLIVVPIVANALASLIFGVAIPPSGIATWVGAVGALLTGTMGIFTLRTKFSPLIAWLVIGTAVFGVFQLVSIRAGFIPFAELYKAPGYASVESNSFAILNYIQRPFAQFPEPSFMAGTLLLSIALMILTSRALRGPLTRLEWTAVVTGGALVALSESGSAILGLGLIAGLLVASATRSLRNQVAAISFIVVVVIVASWVLEQRNSPLNFSWDDRFGSIAVGFEYWSAELSRFLLGLGRGGMTAAFQAGDVSLAGFTFVQPPLDVFSVQGRILIEFGLIAGGFVLLAQFAMIISAARLTRPTVAVFAVLLWILIGAFTISYDAAAWVWAFPGGCLGLLIVSRRGVL